MIAYTNVNLLDGTRDMRLQKDIALIVDERKICDIIPMSSLESYISKYQNDHIVQEYDLHGSYMTPGLINMHVHLPGNGKASKKPRDNKKLVRLLTSNPVTKSIVRKLCADYAAIELYSGVTTIRCVGGILDIDSSIRNEIRSGKRIGPRMLVSDMAITVDGGHMEGSVAKAVNTTEEARQCVRELNERHVDLIKLMITGGVLDGKVAGEPGQLKMNRELVRAACEEAHLSGLSVAAHVEGQEGLLTALECGVDTIEHGAVPTEEMLSLFKKNHASLICTISPAVPFTCFDQKDSYATDMGVENGKIVMNGIIECAKTALQNHIPVGLGNDVGCPFITHYNFWRELDYFVKECHVTPEFALYSATLSNAEIAHIDSYTGSLEVGKYADFIIMEHNPLDDLRELSRITGVSLEGVYIKNPLNRIKKNHHIDSLFDQVSGK